jgi:N-acetylglucosaminyldiphosphoundecaprenol N-acetyl-beta-D-mannosaminyltransferase
VNPETGHVNILGVKVNCDDKQSILNKAVEWAGENTPRTITYVNAHCINLSFQNREYLDVINQADLVYSDGISVVWASQILGGCPLDKVTGREWIFDLCELAIANNLRIYILAGAPSIANRAGVNLRNRWPALKIVGTSDGYFLEKTNDQILEEINSTKPHVLLVGMGSPQQEFWISKHRNIISAPICWSVGALFDYVAGVEPSVPSWMNKLALEWMWRLFIDPKGKWKRYIIGNPSFAARVLHQKLLSVLK